MSQEARGCCFSFPRIKAGPFRKTRFGIAVALLWTAFSLFLAVLTLVSLLQPTWLHNERLGSTGLQTLCLRTTRCPVVLSWNLDKVPSAAWKWTIALQLCACVLLCLCPNVVVLAHCFAGKMRNRGFLFGGIMQACGALLLFVACFLFPFGWSAPAVRQLCGPHAGAFSPGDCTLGWAYVLAILSAFDAAVLSVIILFLYERQERAHDNSVNQPLFGCTSDAGSSHCSSHSESGHVVSIS